MQPSMTSDDQKSSIQMKGTIRNNVVAHNLATTGPKINPRLVLETERAAASNDNNQGSKQALAVFFWQPTQLNCRLACHNAQIAL